MQSEQPVKAPGREAEGEASSRDEEVESASPRKAGAVARSFLLRFVAVALGVGVLFAQTRGTRLGFPNDAVYYLSAAESIVHGDGLSSGLFFSERLARASNGETIPDLHRWPTVEAEPGEAVAARPSHPWTAWPLGFPLLAAAFLGALPASVAPWACQAAALVTFLVAIGALARRISGERFATSMMFLFAMLPCVQMSARIFTSDLWCVAVSVLALHALVAWWQSAQRSWLLAASAAATACILVRYLGAILGAYVLAAVAWRTFQQRSPRREGAAAILVVALPCALVGIPMALRNHALSGFFGGVERLPSQRGLLANTRDAVETILASALPIVREIPGRADLVVSGIYVVLLGALTVWQIRRARLRAELPAGFSLLVGFGLLYTVALIVVRSRLLADDLAPRLLLPSLVALVLALAVWLHARLPNNVALALLVAYLPAYAIGLGAGTIEKRDIWQAFHSDGSLERAAEVKRMLGDAPGAAATIYSDRAVEVHLALSTPVHWLPSTAALESITRRGGSAAYVVAHGSGYFPDVQAETAYTAWLGLHANRVVRGLHFDVFRVSGVATMKPSGEPLPAR